ncbi:adenine nucleotide alpha hydrolases-like protein [Nemania sp. FL0916]|nr:adenine nucleotide alpha hydrolases-like protein [Nemania sp. FL0916]
MTQNPGDSSTSSVTTYQASVAANGDPAKSESASLPSRSLYEACLDIRKKVDGFLAETPTTDLLRRTQLRVREALQVVEEAFQRYDPQELSISYNGGKDCLVLLIIILAYLPRRYPPPNNNNSSKSPNGYTESPRFPEKFKAVYIVSPHPFIEIDDFVLSSSTDYQLDVTRYELGMKKGLEIYLAQHSDIKAIFVGTRRTDPHGEKLTHFDPTDGGWPDFMRIHPVIDWHYAEIWTFIRHLQIPYCPLYDQGYTSLGGTKDTLPNPHLRKQGMNGSGFRPAYELVGDDEERLGRDK